MTKKKSSVANAMRIGEYFKEECKLDDILLDSTKWCKLMGYTPGEYILALLATTASHVAIQCEDLSNEHKTNFIVIFDRFLTNAFKTARKVRGK